MYVEDVQVADTRLPPACHSPTLCELPDNGLLLAWYAGSFEGAADTVLASARRTADGAWTAPRVVLSLPGLPVGNPVLWREAEMVTLFFVIVYGSWWTESKLACMRSHDYGETWSAPSILRTESGIMCRAAPLRTRGGALLLPVYDERALAPLVLRQEAETAEWELIGDTTAHGKAIQPALAELPDESILMLSRTNQGCLYQSWSFNAGRSWTASQPATIPNPNSSVAVTSLPGGTLLLAYNPDERGRERMALARSDDGGVTWSPPRILAQGRGEYSYPFMALSRDGTRVHLVFTVHRTHFRYMALDEPWLSSMDLALKTWTPSTGQHPEHG